MLASTRCISLKNKKAADIHKAGAIAALPSTGTMSTVIVPSKSNPKQPHIDNVYPSGRRECNKNCPGYSADEEMTYHLEIVISAGLQITQQFSRISGPASMPTFPGCGNTLKPSGVIGELPGDLVIVSFMPRQFRREGEVHTKEGNIYFQVQQDVSGSGSQRWTHGCIAPFQMQLRDC